MSCQCSDKYSKLKTIYKKNSCDNCECETPCEIPPCPVHLGGECVQYTGCELFCTGINPGDTFNVIVSKLDAKMNYLEKLYLQIVECNRLKNESSDENL